MTQLMIRLQWAIWWREPRLRACCWAWPWRWSAPPPGPPFDILDKRLSRLQLPRLASSEDAAHPCNMAHFGDFAFRPSGRWLSTLEESKLASERSCELRVTARGPRCTPTRHGLGPWPATLPPTPPSCCRRWFPSC